jgi:sugar phosphate isomerase/epimerase
MPKFGVITVSYVGEINDWQGGLSWPELMEKYRQEWTLDDLDRRLARIKSLGFDYIELYKGDVGFETWGDDSADRIIEVMDNHDLALASYCVGGIGNDEDFEHYFAFAEKLGTDLLTGTLGRDPGLVDRLAETCQRWGKRYAIEPHGKATTLSDPAEIKAAIDRYPDQLGACPDTGWFAKEGFDPVAGVELLKNDTLHTHLKGWKHDAERACAPGDGDLDMARIIRILSDNGYDEVWSIEWEAPYDPSEDLARSREFVARVLAE